MSTLPSADMERKEESGALTAEGLFRRRARQRPNVAAVVDPPNRQTLTFERPRSFTYAEADAAIDALAASFIELGLQPGDRIAAQLPNLVEAPLTLLAAWRAGLTVVALPMLWRGFELGRVCDEVEPRALVGVSYFAGENHAERLCEVAATHYSVRFVLGFGSGLPDGVASLDETIEAGRQDRRPEPVTAPSRKGPAMITFTARSGAPLVSVFREEDEILAQGAMTVLALSLESRDVLLNPYPLTGPPGLSLGLAPWLISGATLVQHQPFDYIRFVGQLLATGATVTAVPSPIFAELVKDGVLQKPDMKLRRLGVVWSVPELAQSQPAPEATGMQLFDLYPLGDLASLVQRREGSANLARLPLGKIHLGEKAEGAVFLEAKLAESGSGEGDGELMLRGPVVPHGPAGGPAAADSDTFVATGLRGAAEGGRVRIKRDPELLYHGGFAIAASELDALYQRFPGFLDAAAFVLSDAIVGDRIFAAIVPSPNEPISLEGLHRALKEQGVAPYKFPDKLLVVKQIPRDGQGRVLRDEILRQV